MWAITLIKLKILVVFSIFQDEKVITIEIVFVVIRLKLVITDFNSSIVLESSLGFLLQNIESDNGPWGASMFLYSVY